MKTCLKCNIEKEDTEFYTDRRNSNNLQARCKSCCRESGNSYSRTKNGLITRIYAHQRDNSRKRGHKTPNYTLNELRKWVYSQNNFDSLFNNWKQSNYNVKLTPSIDRLNDYLPYSFDNIQLITAIENIRKANSDAKNGITNKMNKAVLQYGLDGNFIREYFSLKEAERITDISNGSISNVCIKRCKTAGKFVWKFK